MSNKTCLRGIDGNKKLLSESKGHVGINQNVQKLKRDENVSLFIRTFDLLIKTVA